MASGIPNLEQTFSIGDKVIVDGMNGEVIINPSSESIAYFVRIISETGDTSDLPDVDRENLSTRDGTPVVVRANVDLPDACTTAIRLGARGIGLYRSESLIRERGVFPSEDEQIIAYKQIGRAAGEDGVRIRTFDIESDQVGENSAAERNPALGLRSIRLSLSESAQFRAQIRAILQASYFEKIDIVLPMICGVSDVFRSKALIAEVREDLAKEGILIGDPQIGAMIEVPSSVLTVDKIAENVDFLCLGTNDLVQYLLAADRDNDSVADWYQSLHPAVIRAISNVVSAADDAGISVSVCGEMAGSAFYVPLLIGLGARELSMNVNSIQQIRHLISGITIHDAAKLVDSVRTCATTDETENVLRDFYLDNWKDLFSPGLLNTRHR